MQVALMRLNGAARRHKRLNTEDTFYVENKTSVLYYMVHMQRFDHFKRFDVNDIQIVIILQIENNVQPLTQRQSANALMW